MMTAALRLASNLKPKIRVKGKEYASLDEMPARVRQAYHRAIGSDALFRSGAKLAAKLNAKIIVDGAEFNNPGELPVALRKIYHDTLATILPEEVTPPPKPAIKDILRKILFLLLLVSGLVTAAGLWWHRF
jgi:hypothetical protein